VISLGWGATLLGAMALSAVLVLVKGVLDVIGWLTRESD
jgi:hypothetical protein